MRKVFLSNTDNLVLKVAQSEKKRILLPVIPTESVGRNVTIFVGVSRPILP